MKRMLGLSLLCVLLGVGLAAAQQPAPNAAHGEHEGCDHHRGGGPGRGHGKMLKKMDTDNDGRITRDEFTAGTQAHFKRMDKNNDGVITEDELRQMHEDHGRHHEGPHGHGPRGGAGNGG